jgi:hypothetical protein
MSRIIIATALALAAVVSAAPVQAQTFRTYVSTTGNDNNPCSITEPCRHFQAAVDATPAGGEVDALDPGGYSSITISQAITIEGQGWSYVSPPTGGNAITINAVSGNVVIRGVSLNGVGVTGGTNGIVFNSGSSLTVADCILQNFGNSGNLTTGNGVFIQPASGAISFAITNTTASNNGFVGIRYNPPSGSTATATGIIDHVVATSNQQNGIGINTQFGGGTTTVAISNSIGSDNSNNGIVVENSGNALTVSIDNSSANNNGGSGINAIGTPIVLLGRSVITGNVVGVDNSTSPNTFYSYGNNAINQNGTDVTPTAMTSYTLK